MERSQIKLILILLLVLFEKIFAQGLYVEPSHPIYPFLERMEAIGVIENFSNEHKPLLRTKIAEYLSQIFDKRFSLTKVEREIFNEFFDEFYFDITGKLDKYEILISSRKFDFLSEREKFLYAYSDEDKFSIFVKSHINLFIAQKKHDGLAQMFEGGGRVYGNIQNAIGFEIDGKNGYVFGSKTTALQVQDLASNFKLNEKPESRFFDRAYGYLNLEFSNINFSVGKNRETIGYGINKLILSDLSPDFDRIFLSFNYKSFEFLYSHGWLQSLRPFTTNYFSNRYFVHHRISFTAFSKFKIGVGEAVVYKRTSPELAYLNPFNFYKSVEHQLQDRDNSLIYFDFEALPFKSLRFYSTFLIDDIDFSKIGKHWHGNKTAFQIGSNYYFNFLEKPMDFQIEYSRLEPYTFTHRFEDLSYVNFGLPLSTNQPPNSYQVDFSFNFYLTHELKLSSNYSFTKWGRNPVVNGNLRNVGGDIFFGKQETDSDNVIFLDGQIETIHSFNIKMNYELIPNFMINSDFKLKKFSSGSSSLILVIGLISFL